MITNSNVTLNKSSYENFEIEQGRNVAAELAWVVNFVSVKRMTP